MIVLVTPHSLEPSAIEATARTIEGLPDLCHIVMRNSLGEILMEDGQLAVSSSNPHFLVFAIENQGYAQSAVIKEN